MTITERAAQSPVEQAVARMRSEMSRRGRARVDEGLRARRLENAESAYGRWEAAIAANLPHAEVAFRWDSYLALARLAAE